MRLLASTFLLAACTPAVPDARADELPLADFILVDKSERKLWVYSGSDVVRTYTGLQFGEAPLGHKQFGLNA